MRNRCCFNPFILTTELRNKFGSFVAKMKDAQGTAQDVMIYSYFTLKCSESFIKKKDVIGFFLEYMKI